MTTLASVRDPSFIATVETWAAERGELLAMFRWPDAAGARSYELFQSSAALADRVAELPARTAVIVFRERWLPVRGLVTEDLVRQALDAVADDAEYLIVGLDTVTHGRVTSHPNAAGESREALTEHLRNWWPGVRVAVGPHPPWWDLADGVLAAYVPDRDGTVTPAAY
jgi:hypothetical protein